MVCLKRSGYQTQPAPTSVGGTSGATLTVGTTVQLRPVPPEAAPPVIDPFLRRASP